jgi:hypothetical protein
MEQACELGGIAVFQRNPLCNSCFPRCTHREIQHWYRRIQQRDVKTKSRQANGRGPCAASEIQRTQRVFGPGRRGKKILQIGKGQVGAQPSLGRADEVRGILVGAALKAFAVGFGSHLRVTLVFTQLSSEALLQSSRWPSTDDGWIGGNKS